MTAAMCCLLQQVAPVFTALFPRPRPIYVTLVDGQNWSKEVRVISDEQGSPGTRRIMTAGPTGDDYSSKSDDEAAVVARWYGASCDVGKLERGADVDVRRKFGKRPNTCFGEAYASVWYCLKFPCAQNEYVALVFIDNLVINCESVMNANCLISSKI
jgi:hypothetical protein